MIINTGGRTDTVQHYMEWLLNRFSEGYVLSRNPLFPNKVVRYELDPAGRLRGVMLQGLLPHPSETSRDHRPLQHNFHYTITPYGKDIEPGVPSVDGSIATLIRLSESVGARRVAWRYDPVLLTDRYTVETHIENFESMAEMISSYVDRCIFSFVEMYRKLERNMPELVPMTDDDRNTIAEAIGRISRKNGMTVQTCGTNGDFSRFGIECSGCMTLDILGNANGVEFRRLKHKGMREGCHCIESRDIGAYDTCPNGCRYCYANNSPDRVRANISLHDPSSPLLIGHVRPEDTVIQGMQKSFLKVRR